MCNAQASVLRGDMNCDGVVNFKDINPFVAILSGGTPCSFANADCNDDGAASRTLTRLSRCSLVADEGVIRSCGVLVEQHPERRIVLSRQLPS